MAKNIIFRHQRNTPSHILQFHEILFSNFQGIFFTSIPDEITEILKIDFLMR